MWGLRGTQVQAGGQTLTPTPNHLHLAHPAPSPPPRSPGGWPGPWPPPGPRPPTPGCCPPHGRHPLAPPRRPPPPGPQPRTRCPGRGWASGPATQQWSGKGCVRWEAGGRRETLRRIVWPGLSTRSRAHPQQSPWRTLVRNVVTPQATGSRAQGVPAPRAAAAASCMPLTHCGESVPTLTSRPDARPANSAASVSEWTWGSRRAGRAHDARPAHVPRPLPTPPRFQPIPPPTIAGLAPAASRALAMMSILTKLVMHCTRGRRSRTAAHADHHSDAIEPCGRAGRGHLWGELAWPGDGRWSG